MNGCTKDSEKVLRICFIERDLSACLSDYVRDRRAVFRKGSEACYGATPMRVQHYVIYHPQKQIMSDVLTIYRLTATGYERQNTTLFPALKLGLTLREGTFEHRYDTWLRWTFV